MRAEPIATRDSRGRKSRGALPKDRDAPRYICEPCVDPREQCRSAPEELDLRLQAEKLRVVLRLFLDARTEGPGGIHE